MALECRENLVRETTCDPLRNLGMGWIPLLRPCLHGQSDGRIPRLSDALQAPHLDLSDQFQAAFRRILNVLPKQIPVVGQGGDREPADGDVLSHEKAWRQTFAIPFVSTNGTNDVFA